jgi:hypothetical protein
LHQTKIARELIDDLFIIKNLSKEFLNIDEKLTILSANVSSLHNIVSTWQENQATEYLKKSKESDEESK